MFHLPLPKFLDGNHIGITVIQMVLAAIVMFINKKFLSRMESVPVHRAWIHWSDGVYDIVPSGALYTGCR